MAAALHVLKPLPRAQTVLGELPLSDELAHQVGRDRAEVCDILKGKDPRKMLIIGPCSAWPSESVIAYAEKLKPLADEVADKLKIILRCYIQKPRTKLGWLGPLNQVDPYAPADIESGIYYCREMMLRVIELGLPLADEALFTHNDGYFVDLLSWIAIGARSVEDQEHRIFASMIPHPVGLKNPTSGNIRIAVNSIVAAQNPHVFALHGNQVRTSGNPFAHLILRGGNKKPNHTPEKIHKAITTLHDQKVDNPAIVIDASHDNSCDENGAKDHRRQPLVMREIVDSMNADPAIMTAVKGFMVESFLKPGKQSLADHTAVDQLDPAVSITDGCLGWDETEAMIREVAGRL